MPERILAVAVHQGAALALLTGQRVGGQACRRTGFQAVLRLGVRAVARFSGGCFFPGFCSPLLWIFWLPVWPFPRFYLALYSFQRIVPIKGSQPDGDFGLPVSVGQVMHRPSSALHHSWWRMQA